MTIYSDNIRSDPQIVSGILARMVLDHLAHADRIAPITTIMNVIRLLEMYKHDSFATRSPQGVLQRRSMEIPHDPFPHEGHKLEVVKQAMQEAHQQVYGTMSKDEVTGSLERVLASIIKPGASSPQTELDQAQNFFRVLSDTLAKNISVGQAADAP